VYCEDISIIDRCDIAHNMSSALPAAISNNIGKALGSKRY